MRITVLVGSPRKGGNTETLADALIAGARSAGAEVVKFTVRGKKIAPCVNCDYCQTHDRCAIDDDMPEVYTLLSNTDALVFASPVYFYNLSAQLKALIDRLYNPVRARFPIRYTALLSVCADDTQRAFDPMRATIAAIEDYLGWKRLGEVTVDHLEKKGDIAGHEALARATALGQKLASAAL
ncbi:MAG TPA: flavodoxin family protein [Candidatus Limiplasma sp.]|nr:flavodoxin family protein [Candidatus Limiplasma sp.]HPS80286.1 flavodoxin family protein [Candidatus Limiplasma sp.]